MKRELDEIKVAYLAEREAGRVPTLEELVTRHPQYREELVDFVMTCLELDRCLEAQVELPEASSSTGRLRGEAVRAVFGARPLRETLAEEGISREQIAAATNVPVTFIVRVERGRLDPGGEEPVDSRFLERLARALRRTVAETLEVLQVTFLIPQRKHGASHLRSKGVPGPSPDRPIGQSFRDLLAGCEDLSASQRREWLGAGNRHKGGRTTQR